MDYPTFHCNPFHISHSISLSYASSKLASIFLIIPLDCICLYYMHNCMFTPDHGDHLIGIYFIEFFFKCKHNFSMFHSLGFFNSSPRDDDTPCLKSRTESHSRTNNIFSFPIWDELCFKFFRVRS